MLRTKKISKQLCYACKRYRRSKDKGIIPLKGRGGRDTKPRCLFWQPNLPKTDFDVCMCSACCRDSPVCALLPLLSLRSAEIASMFFLKVSRLRTPFSWIDPSFDAVVCLLSNQFEWLVILVLFLFSRVRVTST